MIGSMHICWNDMPALPCSKIGVNLDFLVENVKNYLKKYFYACFTCRNVQM